LISGVHSGMGDRFVGPWNKLSYAVGIACSLYYMWTALVGIHHPQIDRSLFILVGIILGFAMKPAGRSLPLRILDALFLIGAVAATLRFIIKYEDFVASIGLPISDLDMAFGWFMVAACLESCRRALGLSVPIIAVSFLIYFRFGSVVPAPFTHADFDFRTIASYMYAGTDGLYSDLTYVLASQMFLFLVFGTFLLHSGASDFFSRAALALVGHKVGGTAKAAVASSAVIGSITGSAAANAAVVGTVTIPLMKAAGFKPHVAAGIEAAASTGGTILPPVMGVTAFLMVALTGIPYSTIAIYSAVPALLYFLFVYAQVHFYARRNGLSGEPRSQLPPIGPTLKSGWHYIIPVVVVVAMVWFNYSLAFTALVAIGATLVTSWVRADSRMGPREILDCLAQGAQHALPIMAVAGPVAIMSECLLVPGTGLRLTGLIISTGHGSLAATLALVYAIAYVVGMGLSVVPAYLILATLAAPALIQLHVPVLAAFARHVVESDFEHQAARSNGCLYHVFHCRSGAVADWLGSGAQRRGAVLPAFAVRLSAATPSEWHACRDRHHHHGNHPRHRLLRRRDRRLFPAFAELASASRSRGRRLPARVHSRPNIVRRGCMRDHGRNLHIKLHRQGRAGHKAGTT
jgi:TRAP transporter 4TM/12TM fusion protein